MRRGRSLLAGAVLALCVAAPAAFSAPTPEGALTPQQQSVTWTGGPITGTGDCATAQVGCEDHALPIAVPADYWDARPGGVAIRISWTAPETELDLHVYDPTGREVALETFGGRDHQQVYLYRPSPGTYTVEVVGFSDVAVTYEGRAAIVADDVAPADVRDTGTMRFSSGTVDPQMLSNEPGVDVSPDGKLFVNSPLGLRSGPISLAWRSRDHGATFHPLQQQINGVGMPTRQPCAGSLGSADSDLAIDRTGRVYFAALEPTAVSIGVSTDDGATWTCNPVANTTPEDDRPWLATAPSADGAGPGVDAYLSYIDLAVDQLPLGRDLKPGRVHVDVTRDGGLTWSPAGAFGTDLPADGTAVVGSDGTFYESFGSDESVWLARSTDGAHTFDISRVRARPGNPDNTFTQTAVGPNGTVFVAWSDAGSFHLLLATSRDGGRTFGPPVRISPDGQAAVLPSLTVAPDGAPVLAWYAANTSDPTYADATTAWQVWAARGAADGRRAPAFDLGQVSSTPVHYGELCMFPTCGGAHTGLADFLSVGVDGSGAIVVAYADNGRSGAAPMPYLRVAREHLVNDEPGHGRGHGRGLDNGHHGEDANLQPEPAGDATWPPDTAGAVDNPALDFTSVPQLVDSQQLRLSLDSTRDLSTALTAGPGGHAHDAYWLLLWHTPPHVYYAVMHVSGSGPPDFYGGVDPTAVDNLGQDKELVATYPAAVPLSGLVDPATGTVTVDISALKLAGGTELHDVQAFSMVGDGGPVTQLTMLDLVDATPSASLTLPTS